MAQVNTVQWSTSPPVDTTDRGRPQPAQARRSLVAGPLWERPTA
ncbi:hypothetical protein JOE68_001564 [Saccharothrix algeriensis]|uniref:Uncharacterized protein n=1 Tax=Saccharothrix algeriensis TaxID=173560 RepID=A0ABS2S391_9PSEU|nr:hypothetical protein [Saccharothrix algeriensis]